MTLPDGLLTTIAGVALGGWNALLTIRIRQLDKLTEWQEKFLREYADDKLKIAVTYASRDDLKESLGKIETHLEKIETRFDERMEGLSVKFSERFRELGGKVDDLAQRVRNER